jgi:hypothetical protein
VLAKPFRIDELLELLDELLGAKDQPDCTAGVAPAVHGVAHQP